MCIQQSSDGQFLNLFPHSSVILLKHATHDPYEVYMCMAHFYTALLMRFPYISIYLEASTVFKPSKSGLPFFSFDKARDKRVY